MACRSRLPRHSEGPNTEDDRPRTAQAIKAEAPQQAAPPMGSTSMKLTL
jgi:hypothetical protein